MSAPQPSPILRFLPLFAVALGVRLLVVVLGIAMIPVQPPKPIRIFGAGVAGYPADMRLEDDALGPRQLRERIQATSAAVVEPWYRWDATWFAVIAQEGYAHETIGPNGKLGPHGVAFPPLMPAILAAADASGLNPFWVGLLAANLAGAAGAALLAQIATRLTADRDLGIRAFALLLAFPSAFFFSAPYHESFGLLFTGLALTAWLDARPLRGSLFAALGSFARIAGVALGVAALGSWLISDRTRRGFWLALILTIGSFVGVVFYWGYVGWAVGNPFAGLTGHSAWGRRSLSIENPWFAMESLSDHRVLWIDLIAALLVTVLGVRAWLRRGAFWGLLTLVPVGLMLMSGTFLSGHRVVLASVPAFIELADVLRNRLHFRLTVVVFAFIQLVLVNRYVHWQWAG